MGEQGLICFEVSLNGEVACTAGLPNSLLHLYLNSFGDSNGISIDVGATTLVDKNEDLAPKLRAALQRPSQRQYIRVGGCDPKSRR